MIKKIKKQNWSIRVKIQDDSILMLLDVQDNKDVVATKDKKGINLILNQIRIFLNNKIKEI